MPNLNVGRALHNRRDQLLKDKRDAEVQEVLDPSLAEDEKAVNSSKIAEAITTIEAHEDYKAHQEAETLRRAIMDAVNGDDAPATLEQMRAAAEALKLSA